MSLKPLLILLIYVTNLRQHDCGTVCTPTLLLSILLTSLISSLTVPSLTFLLVSSFPLCSPLPSHCFTDVLPGSHQKKWDRNHLSKILEAFYKQKEPGKDCWRFYYHDQFDRYIIENCNIEVKGDGYSLSFKNQTRSLGNLTLLSFPSFPPSYPLLTQAFEE